jgi:hypothetical protein
MDVQRKVPNAPMKTRGTVSRLTEDEAKEMNETGEVWRVNEAALVVPVGNSRNPATNKNLSWANWVQRKKTLNKTASATAATKRRSQGGKRRGRGVTRRGRK